MVAQNTIWRRGLFLSLTALLLATGLLPFLGARASAYDDSQVIATWVNASTVRIEVINASITDGSLELPLAEAGGDFFDSNIYDGNPNYKNPAQDEGCRSQLFADPTNPNAGTLRLHTRNPVNGTCRQRQESITLKSPASANTFFEWVDQENIRGLSTTGAERNATFTFSRITGTFLSSYNEDGCRDYITVGADRNFGVFRQYDKGRAETDCEVRDPENHNVGIGKLAENGSLPPGTGDIDDLPGAGETDDDTCESKGGAMGWILCPIINILDGALNWVDTQIQGLLAIDEDKYTNEDLKTAWLSIRNIAYIVLLPIMLVMVIGTALGFDTFSAYTVKKALPRMVIAVIFIAFSWEICTFLIGFFNAVGGGILGLITSPFREQLPATCQDGNLNLSCLFSVDSNINAAEGALHGILFLVEAAASLVGILIFLIFFGTTMLLAVGAAFLVLLARQMFIIALLLVAPLAILAWIFPGNDALWKGWWSAFSKLLMMFPLIMLIIGVGRIFAMLLNITDGGGLDGAILNPIMKLGAYMLPYAFIPFTFKFAGGLFANLAGIVNDKNKGLFDRAKKGRAAKKQRLFAGEFGPRPLRRIGRGLGAFTEPGAKKRSVLTGRGRQELMAQQNKLNEMRYGKSERAQGSKDNDYMLRAQTYRSAGEARERLAADWGMNDQEIQTAISAANAAGGFSAQRQNYATRQLAATTTGYDNIEQVQATVSRVAGSNRSMAADLLGEINAVTKSSRHDLAPGFTNHMDMYDAVQARGGYQAGGGPVLTADESRRAYVQAATDIDSVTYGRDKRKSVENMSDALRDSFTVAERDANDATLLPTQRRIAQAEMGRLAGVIAKLDTQATPYASANNIEEMSRRVIEPTSGQGGPTTTVTGPAGTPMLVPTAGRQAVVANTSQTQVQVNPLTNSLENTILTVYNPATGRREQVVDQNTGRAIPNVNPTINPDMEEQYRRQAPRGIGDPNDPNRQ